MDKDTVVIRQLIRNQNLTIVCQNLTKAGSDISGVYGKPLMVSIAPIYVLVYLGTPLANHWWWCHLGHNIRTINLSSDFPSDRSH